MKKTPLHLEILREIFTYIMIAISWVIYLNHKCLNILVFWRSFPTYKVWLTNRRVNIVGLVLALLVASWFVNLVLFCFVFVIYLGMKSVDVSRVIRK